MVKLIEEGETHGVHDPEIADELDVQKDRVLLAINWVEQTIGLKSAEGKLERPPTSLEVMKGKAETVKGSTTQLWQ